MHTDHLMTQYFNEIAAPEYDPIDNEKIQKLVAIAQAGYNKETKKWETEEAVEARDEIVKRNIRLVPYVIHKVIKDNNKTLFMDCVNECHFAILKCIVGYDPESKTNFATYAQVSIRRHAWRFIRENSSSVKLPANKVAERRKAEEEVYANPGVLDRLFSRDFKPVHHVCSLDYNYDDGKKHHDRPFKDVPIDDSASDKLYEVEIIDLVLDSLQCLTDKEKTIIEKRYLEEHKRTLRDIASDIGMSGERVRQIEQRALIKMKNHLRFEKGEER
jgi:RNA polymerase nonessential primary-like sigma factor